MKKIVFFIAFMAAVSFSFLYHKPLPPIQVGILHSLSGTMAMSERPVMEASLLAIEDINAHGGLLGRKIEAIVVDGQSNNQVFAREANSLITEKHVSALFGCWTSACRKTIKPIVEKHQNILFYPVQYEGLEQSPNIIYLGATPNQQTFPALDWAVSHLGARVYLLGSDYVFPRVMNWLIHQRLMNAPIATVVGERYLPLGDKNMTDVMADLKALHPDVILNSINGDSNTAFFHALKQAGLTAKDYPVISLSLGEPEIAELAGDGVGHYASWSYFQSLKSSQNDALIAAYHQRFGENKPVSDPMEAAWIGVHLWAEAVKTAQTDDVNAILHVIKHQSMLAPEGIVSIDHATQHAWKTSRIGQIGADQQLHEVWSSNHLIRPIPYPFFISKTKANHVMASMYETWDGHWEAPVSPVQGASHE